MLENKIFIIGLPRTSTTSVCCAMLDFGFTVAHTAYTQRTFEQATVIADTPIFCDYQQLDKQYPNSKFIYLTRDLSLWLPSIKQLLNRMFINITRSDGGFNLIIKRCYTKTFSPFNFNNINDDDFLTVCFEQHQQQVFDYFADRKADLLVINVAEADSYQQLASFLLLETKANGFEKINQVAKVTAWKAIKNPLKIESTKNGKIDASLCISDN